MRVTPETLMEGKVGVEADRLETVIIKRPARYLCFRCTNSHVYRTEGANHDTIYCNQVSEKVPDTIVECNRFQAQGTLNIWDLAKLAHVIEPVGKEKAGFKK